MFELFFSVVAHVVSAIENDLVLVIFPNALNITHYDIGVSFGSLLTRYRLCGTSHHAIPEARNTTFD